MPLELRLLGNSAAQRHRAAIFYADIAVREGMALDRPLLKLEPPMSAGKLWGIN